MDATYFDTFERAVGNCPDKQGALGEEYVVFPPNPDYGYECTPRNALTFGAMGVDGVHYAILTTSGVVSDDSPVIQICPMDFSDPYQVLCESFLGFLAAACNASVSQMAKVFAEEREGKQTLVTFLKERFVKSRLWQNRSPKLDRFLDLIEPKP
jgi:hypothetical protein